VSSSRLEGSTRLDAYPYRYAREPLGLEYVSYTLDGGASQTPDDPLALDLSGEAEGSWDVATLTVRTTVTDDILDRVTPAGSSRDVALVVEGYCPTNHHRFVSLVEGGPLSAGEHQGPVELEYEKLRGRVYLTLFLVRMDPLGGQPAGHTGPPFAEQVGKKLAHSPRGYVDIDEPTGGKSSNLPTIPKSFDDPTIPADEGNMWYLDLTDEGSPRLYINSDHGYLESLFEDKGQHGRGRVRQLVIDLFGTQIMTQFVLEAAELYVVHGEMKYPWQEKMLTEVCSDLFASKSPDEVEEMLQPGELSENVNQIATTVQRRRAPHESLERVLDLSL
jgi:hypothetical protein